MTCDSLINLYEFSCELVMTFHEERHDCKTGNGSNFPPPSLDWSASVSHWQVDVHA